MKSIVKPGINLNVERLKGLSEYAIYFKPEDNGEIEEYGGWVE